MFKHIWQWIHVAFKVITTIRKHEALIKPVIEEATRELERRNTANTDLVSGEDSRPVGDPPPDLAHENK